MANKTMAAYDNAITMIKPLVQSILGHAEDKVDSDSLRYLFSTMFLAITGGQVVVVQPGYVQGLVEFAGFTDKQAGYITSAEMFGFLFTTLLLIYIAPRSSHGSA